MSPQFNGFRRARRSTREDRRRRRSAFQTEFLERRELLAIGDPQILLTPALLAKFQQEAAANTPQWQAFKSNLDNQLNDVFGPGTYQGDYLTLIADYALGYQILKDNPATVATADNYADKAIGLMKSGMNDYQRGTGTQAFQFLARGDATTTTYTLPGANINPDTVVVRIDPINTVQVTHGSANGQDEVDYSQTFLKVSNTSDGPANYVEGTDWRHNPDFANNEIDWSLPGAEPAPGANYFVTETSSSDSNGVDLPRDTPDNPGGNFYTLNGNTLKFDKPLGTGQAVFVEYVYGVHKADGSSLAFQQTSAGDGGFNSIFVDTGYTSRYLGKYISIGLDWLYNYPGLTPGLKQQATNLLVRWSDYARDNGYYANSPGSNYGAGEYDSRVMTALALSNGRDPANDPRLIQEVLAYRNNNVKPLLTAPTTSDKGGFWAEGWNYGPLAIQNILLAGQALETAGLSSGAEEHQWASEIIQSLISEQPTKATIYDGGDGYNFPAPIPNKDLTVLLAANTTDPTLRSYANFMVQNYPNGFGENTPSLWVDLFYRDPAASASFWSSFPLQYKADGQGLVTARADWNYNSTFVSLQMGNIIQADHQTFSPGLMEILRGGDDLLVNANAESGVQPDQSQYANTVVIDANGDTNTDGSSVQTYPFNMGEWYGTPGVSLTAFDASSGFVYAAGDYRAAYSTPNDPGGGGPATKLTRQLVYLRPDLIVVHDRVGTLKASYLKQLRWSVENQPTVTGNSFVEQVGSSKLFGATFSDAALKTSVTSFNTPGGSPAGYDPRPFYQVNISNSAPAANVNYTTAFQTAPSSASAMVATTAVKSADGLMEGVEMGDALVLFGKDGILPGSVSTITVNLTGPAPSTALFVDLQPGKTYQIDINGVKLGLTADAQGTASLNTGVSVNDTTTALAASANPGTVGKAETFTATVAIVSPGTGALTGTVTFKDGNTTLGTAPLSTVNGVTTAKFTTTKLGRGTHAITAVYSGDANNRGSNSSALSLVIKNGTSVALAASANPVGVNHAETFTATVKVLTAGAIAPTGTVTFKDGNTTLGTAPLSTTKGVTKATFTTSKLALGTHAITAVYSGNVNDLGSTSTALSIAVRRPTSILVSASANPVVVGRSTTLKATVRVVSPATGIPTGTVTLMDGATALGTVKLVNNKGVVSASLSTSKLTVGTHKITVVYNGDASDLKSKSAVFSEVVKPNGKVRTSHVRFALARLSAAWQALISS